MSQYTSGIPHPYGVLPTGNAIFEDKPFLLRNRGLGVVSIATDEAVIEILSYLSADDLARSIFSSKALYVYGHHSDLWRDLTLRRWKGRVAFIASWKDTFSKMRLSENLPVSVTSVEDFYSPHKPLKIRTVYSNLLHRSWICRSCDFEHACPGFYKNSDIPRHSEAELDAAMFVKDFEQASKPVLITGAVSHWPAMEKWSPEYLSKVCGDQTFRATSATAPIAADFTMRQYFDYAAQTKEEAALYLFDRNFTSVGGLGDDFEVPGFFNPSKSKHGTDLFRVFGEKRRPDYRWLIAGPARSGSIFHIDPNQTNAWNVCVRGRKKWIFYPPNRPPPGVVSSPDGADVTVPLSTGEWLLSFWEAHQEARRSPDPRLRPLECIAEAGEVIFVPDGWWHMVVNLEDCIALTQNYCSTSNLSACLRFFREKTDQISGVRDRAEEAIQPDEMYDEFVKGLKLELPADVLEKAIADSFANKVTIVPKRKAGRLKLFDKESVSSRKRKVGGSAYDSPAEVHPSLSDEIIDGKEGTKRIPEEFSFGFHFSS